MLFKFITAGNRSQLPPPMRNQFSEWYLEPKKFAWKCFVLRDARKYGPYVLYLDSGTVVLKNIKPIYDFIENEDIFLVGSQWKNFQWTTPKCFSIMKATEKKRFPDLCGNSRI